MTEIQEGQAVRTACPMCGAEAERTAYDIGSGAELSCSNCEWCWGANGQDLAACGPIAGWCTVCGRAVPLDNGLIGAHADQDIATPGTTARTCKGTAKPPRPTVNLLQCPRGPHRRPEGPCEDVAVCPKCLSVTFAMRPPGECFGHHAPDCSLPERHESYCKPGGAGHPTGVLRGYPEFTWEARP